MLVTKTVLLIAIHKLETESWLDRLGYIVLFSVGVPFIGYAVFAILLVLGNIESADWLSLAIDGALPTVLNDSLRLTLILVLPVNILLVTFLLLRRVWSDLRARIKTDVNK